MHHDLYFDRHRDLCKTMLAEPPVNKQIGSKDWRSASESLFEGNPMAMMVAMTLMHRYHVGAYAGTDPDPLKAFLGAYRIDAKPIARKIKAEMDGMIEQMEAALKKRKAKIAS